MSEGVATPGEVLRRSHRDELLPLAAILRVSPRGRGRDALAMALEQRLHAAGALHPLAVHLRRRAPPSWTEVVGGVATRMELTAGANAVETERRILEAWRGRGATADQQAAIDRVLALPAQPPTPSDAARQLGPRAPLVRFQMPLLLALFSRLLVPLAPLFMAVMLARAARESRDEVLRGALLELQRLRVLVERRLVVVLVGPPSSGKDAAILALFGLDTGGIHPVAGSTSAVAVYEAPGDDHIQILNTPGLGDVLQALTRETREVLDQADLFLFLVNAQGGVRQRERDEHSRVRQRQRPTLVLVNKLDTLREADRERFLRDVAEKLRVPRAEVVGVAVDPLPQLSETPLGLEGVHRWLSEQLRALGRDPDALRDLG